MTVRGYSPDEAEYQWNNHVRLKDIAHIEPWKESAMLLSII